MTRCAVIGAGAWGSALADRLARNGHDVMIWAYEPDVVESINATHTSRFLAGERLHDAIAASGDITSVVDGADCVVMVAPSHVTRAIAESVAPRLKSACTMVVASKGIEQHTLARMTQVIDEVCSRKSVALSGPSFATEVLQQQPTAVVAACSERALAESVQSLFHAQSFRVYTGDDIVGVELGGAVKNVMAVATGVAEGLGLGFNARAALITRGLAEMTRLGIALGADPRTFAGLAGMGDLVLTCTGLLSRNRALGVEIGSGRTLSEVLEGRQTVAEGVITTRSARALARREKVEMPIVDGVFNVLFGGQPAREAISGLLGRDPRRERDD